MLRRMILSLSLLALVPACAPKQTVEAVPPPAAPERAALTSSYDVAVRTSADLGQFRQIFERELGRAGFRVMTTPEPGTILLNLIGDGNTTSGANGAGSTVHSTMIIDMTVSLDGRLQGEHKSTTKYVAVQDAADKSDDFNKFNARVADYARQSFEWLAVDLSNKLIQVLGSAPPAAPPPSAPPVQSL